MVIWEFVDHKNRKKRRFCVWVSCYFFVGNITIMLCDNFVSYLLPPEWRMHCILRAWAATPSSFWLMRQKIGTDCWGKMYVIRDNFWVALDTFVKYSTTFLSDIARCFWKSFCLYSTPVSCKKSAILHSKWTHLKLCCFFLIYLALLDNKSRTWL